MRRSLGDNIVGSHVIQTPEYEITLTAIGGKQSPDDLMIPIRIPLRLIPDEPGIPASHGPQAHF